MSEVVSKEQCPACRSKGKDTSGDNLVRYSSGSAYCFACGYTESLSSQVKTGISALPWIPETVIPGKQISQKILKKFGVTQFPIMRNDKILGTPKGRKDGNVIAFPYYINPKNPVLVRYKVRDYTLSMKDRFFWPVESNESPKLFGLNTFRGKNSLILTEGESDTLAAFSWLHSEADVLGISGTGNAEALTDVLSTIRQYDAVYVVMDADDAGKEAAKKLYDFMPAAKTWYVELPLGSDFYDVWSTDKRTLRQCFETGYQVTSPKVLVGDSLINHFFSYMQPSNFDCFSTGIPGLDKMLGGGLFPGEVLGLAAHSGHGKTTAVASIVSKLIESVPVFIGSTEMDPALTMVKIIEADLRKPFDYNPENTESVKRVFDVIHTRYHKNLMFYSQVAGDYDDFEEAAKTAIDMGARVVIIDVLSDIDSRIRDWQKAGDIMHKINLLAQGDSSNNIPPCAVICILHTKMVDGKYRQSITQHDVLGGKAVISKLTCGIYMIPSYSQGDFQLLNAARHLHFFKLPRMRTPQASEGVVRFKDYRYV